MLILILPSFFNFSFFPLSLLYSSLDKQRICVNTQLKSSKKQLKLNACVPKSNSVDQCAITCNVIAYHLVHFVSVCVIYRCQSGIDFFTSAYSIILILLIKYRHQSSILAENETLQNGREQLNNVNKAMRFASGTIKIG